MWLHRAMHAGFYVLLAASAARYVAYHGVDPTVLGVAAVLGAAYPLGVRWTGALPLVLVTWLALVWLAPSFGWCAIPLFFQCLRQLRPRHSVPIAAVLTLAVVFGQVRLADTVEPSLVLGPIGVAVITAAVFFDRRRLIHQAGVLQERQRLAREIHDTLAQGLSSINLLLELGDTRRAAEVAKENLAEARRFVRDLSPLQGRSLEDALRGLCDRVEVHGEPYPLTVQTEVALLRVAQGALANVREHAEAHAVVVTLSYLGDAVTLDVCDDGRGFDPSAVTPGQGRGFGLASIRGRVAELGGTLSVESAPGEGTALAVTVPT
ncbi:signal transduction histidine kinase [Saccharothrix tamanrassetensis]|uniref:Oxygen sensor histidine kinase NreB n=1 Tax=Saccharothrix tamanrassetensis TaxID=1051531 RepID=A0A841CCK3_9PSEU|nr:sensor histidine kinase [Saccharothrix tamanrassetensis]MBB5954094.1 signal transduction histidine kinase [Saccharothrix tamanrassetensis]